MWMVTRLQLRHPTPPASRTRYPRKTKEESACVICLEPFRVGDCVSWSRNGRELNCSHVFHSDCILQWLEEKRHDDSPSCRSTLILQPPIHHNNDKTSEADLENYEEEDFPSDDEEQHEEDLNASSSNVFVIMHGLVSSPARRANYSLVGQDLEIETADHGPEPPYCLSIPSPLKRAMSHGSHFSLGDSVRGLFRRRLSFSRSTDEDVENNGDVSSPNNHMEVLQRPFSLRRSVAEGLGTYTGARRSFVTPPPLPPPPSSGVRRRGASSGSTLNTHYTRVATAASGYTAITDSSEHSEEDDLEWLHTPRASWETGGRLSPLDDTFDVSEGSGDIELSERILTPNNFIGNI